MTVMNRVCWMAGGPQGSGVNVSADLFARACVAGGLNVFGNIEYNSNIKGEHSFYRVRAWDFPVRSHVDLVDILVALDHETIQVHAYEMAPGGGIIYDGEEIDLTKSEKGIDGVTERTDIKLFPMPLTTIVKGLYGEGQKPNMIMKNTVSVGASFGFLQYDFSLIERVIRHLFREKKKEVGDFNVRAARAGYDYSKEQYEGEVDVKLQRDGGYERLPTPEKNMLIRGNEALAMGAMKAGLKYYSYYPITPATPVAHYLEEHSGEWNVHVEQTEDEIASVCSVVGAAHAGTRAMTSTSGPGFCLMMEGLGFASLTEIPIVIGLIQRPGPSTGMPTRQDQSDLRFALHAGHGESPRVILIPGDVEECFRFGFEAFNIAEKFQMPVIILSDKHVGESYISQRWFSEENMSVDRGLLATEEEIRKKGKYLRYEITDNGISPRSIPGTPLGMFRTTGDEHTEYGSITEDAMERVRMMEKRFRKMHEVEKYLPEERRVKAFGPSGAGVSIIGWGSTKGAILDAMEMLKSEGVSANYLQITCANPFPKNIVKKFIESSGKRIVIENNYSGIMAGVIREQTGASIEHKIVKYDGRPYSCDIVVKAVKKILKEDITELAVGEHDYVKVRA